MAKISDKIEVTTINKPSDIFNETEEEILEEDVDEISEEEFENIKYDIQKIKEFEPKKHPLAMPNSIISKARAMYICQNMTLKDISLKLNVSLQTLKTYCTEQKWTVFQNNPDMLVFTQELFEEVYDNLDFYVRVKEITKEMIEEDGYKNPKDMKSMVEVYKMAEERSTALRFMGLQSKGDVEL